MAQEGEDIRSEIYDQRQLGYAVLKQVLKTEEVQALLEHYHSLRELDPANRDAFGSAETLGWFQVSPRVPGHRALRVGGRPLTGGPPGRSPQAPAAGPGPHCCRPEATGP